MDRKLNSTLIAIIGLLVGVLFFALTFPENGLLAVGDSSERPVLALMSFLIPIFVAERIAVYYERLEISRIQIKVQELYGERIESVLETIRNSVTLITYPDPAAGIEYLIANVGRARTVLDTRVFYSPDDDDAQISSHRKERAKRFDEARKAALRQGALWRDLYSKNRVQDLEAHLSWEASIKDKVKYALRVLPESHPIINFIVIDYINGNSEVLFGWGYHRFDIQGSVFLSKEESLVNYFRRYYELLWQIGMPRVNSDINSDQSNKSIQPTADASAD